MFALKVFACLAVVLCVSAAPQNGPRQPEQFPAQPQANVGVESLQAGAEDGKDLKGSNSYGYGYYGGGGYPGLGFGGYGSPYGGYGGGYGYSSYYGGYPYYRNFGGLYGGYWY